MDEKQIGSIRRALMASRILLAAVGPSAISKNYKEHTARDPTG